ncbi:MAG: hypothetical protein U1F43_27385 [Myxococcota bacterium]
MPKTLVCAVVVSCLVASCGDTRSGRFATLEAFVAGRPVAAGGVIHVAAGDLAVDAEGTVAELHLINTGEADLVIEDILVDSTPEGAFRLGPDPVPAGAVDALPPGPYTIATQSDVAGVRDLWLRIVLHRPPDGVVPNAVIHVRSNHVDETGRRPVVDFHVALDAGVPVLKASPSPVDFGAVPRGVRARVALALLNPGNDLLVVRGFSLEGHPGFELGVGDETWPTSEATRSGVTFATPLDIAPGDSVEVVAWFTASGPEAARGTLTFDSNDPSAPDGTVVPLSANVDGPCLTVRPSAVDFGGKFVGKPAVIDVELTSCGGKAVSISAIGLVPGGSDGFGLDLASLPGEPAGATALDPSDPPIVLEPNARARLRVTYLATAVAARGDDGLPLRETATLRLATNTFDGQVDVPISAFGADPGCPLPVITVAEGEEVTPQTTLHLSGSDSVAGVGSIASYAWRVRQPVGAQSVFVPSDSDPSPRFEVNVAGSYDFELSVTDTSGNSSCAPAHATVVVTPDEALHIELVWRTPNDDDETNTGPVAGSDLDLHLTHPQAHTPYDIDGDGQDDPWFDTLHDCFWYNPKPDWEAFGSPLDDPHLDRDDTDGAGPENVNLDEPVDGRCYGVAVHYWSDHGFGSAFATVRVYLYGQLAFESPETQLARHDLWRATEVCWPPSAADPIALETVCQGSHDACVDASDCGGPACVAHISPGYVHPSLPMPE